MSAEAEEGAGGSRRPACGGRILLVEDDPLLRRHAITLLEDLGYCVHAEPDARSALSALEAEQDFDLLFTDIVMPGEMNGFDLALAVRDTHPELAVLCTSGWAGATLEERIRDTADFNFIKKPYRRAELARQLRAALG